MKNGFTLVELLAVIVILSILITIVVISVNPILSSSKSSLSEIQKTNVERAAKTYYLREGMSKEQAEGKTESCVNVSELISKGYVESSEVIDPESKDPMIGSVKITYASNQYTYEYQSNSCE